MKRNRYDKNAIENYISFFLINIFFCFFFKKKKCIIWWTNLVFNKHYVHYNLGAFLFDLFEYYCYFTYSIV